jgi:protein-tyrosine phosphatase
MSTTQEEHPVWELPLESGSLFLMPCPGTKGVDLTTSLQQLQTDGCRAVVTLLTFEEIEVKNVTQLGDETQRLGMQWFHIVIEDDHVPDQPFAQKWREASPALHQLLDQGDKVAIHCMGGSGRTGMVAFHLLHEKGWDIDTIIEQVRQRRPGAYTVPMQMEYIQSVAAAAAKRTSD